MKGKPRKYSDSTIFLRKRRQAKLLITSVSLSFVAILFCTIFPWPETRSAFAKMIAGVSFGTLVSAFLLWVKIFLVDAKSDTSRKRTPLSPLVKLVDWIPSKKLRQRITTLIADDQADIRKLQKHQRRYAACWRAFCTWLTVAWYVLLAPLVGLKAVFVGAFTLLGHWASK